VSGAITGAIAIAIARLGPEHLEGFRSLFEASSSACFCRYWHFTGNKNEWLERCAFRPEENMAEQAAAVTTGDPTGRGLVALVEGVVVGWMKLAPRAAVPKLTRLPVYRALSAEDGTWTIGCFQVHPEHRRKGVARRLVEAADGFVVAWGGRVIEAHPRRSTEPLHDEEAWQGPEAAFVAHGYAPFHDVPPYPVYRKVLTRET